MPDAEARIRDLLATEFADLQVDVCDDKLADFEIAPKHPAVGSLLIQIGPDEITFFLGTHTHCHFESEETDDAIEFLRSLLSDQLVIWSWLLAGGVRPRHASRRFRLPWLREFLWSGPYDGDAA